MEINEKISVYDFGDSAFDRYTVVYLCDVENGIYPYLSMNDTPTHLQGFAQHGELEAKDMKNHLGEKITFEKLPVECQKVVKRELEIK